MVDSLQRYEEILDFHPAGLKWQIAVKKEENNSIVITYFYICKAVNFFIFLNYVTEQSNADR